VCITAPREERQKMTGAGNETKDLQETYRNWQEGPNAYRETLQRRTGRLANRQETNRCQWKSVEASVLIKAPPPRAVITERANPRLLTQGCFCDKPRLMTINTKAYLTVTRPDITTRWPKRHPNQHYVLQTVFGKILPILKNIFLMLTLRRHPLKIWAFVANITNKFNLGLDILRAYNASVATNAASCGGRNVMKPWAGPNLPAW
jgi:hypothetical protein